jgi:signal transduction histidine kinase
MNKAMESEKLMNILILEDHYEDFELINRALKRGGLAFESRLVDSKDEFKSTLQSFKPDVILSDHSLAQFNSIEALKICRAGGLNTPFILVTGAVSEEFAVNALKQGVDDYILKSHLDKLGHAISQALSHREAEKVRNLAEENLRKQNEELSKTNRELDSFVYSVSHDIRSPLMSVLGLVDIIQNEGDKVDKTRLFDMLRHSIHRLDDTLLEVIDYSKNSKGEIKKSAIDFKALFLECYETLMYLPGAAEIEKELDVNSNVEFWSDAYRLKIIFRNLISNAIKYRSESRESFITINIEINSEYAIIIFQDNGIGIDAKSLDKIFNMFYRATDQSQGSGLGLYLVKEAVNKLDGKINVDSVPGGGTVFILQIPNLKNSDHPALNNQ